MQPIRFQVGCAFLPACSGRDSLLASPFSGLIIDGSYGSACHYWSSTPYPYNDGAAYNLRSFGGYIEVGGLFNYWGYSVRLVKDV